MAYRNDTHLDILVSYAWMKKGNKFVRNLTEAHKNGDINLMFDSGAFTLFSSDNRKNYTHINLNDYCDFLHEHSEHCEKYVMLDKIGDEAQSKRNYEEMIKRGLDPMYVFTMFDDEWSYLEDAVKRNRHVCVAGGVTTKGDWMTKRYQEVDRRTDALIHGLGYVSYPKMYQLPLHSVDSSSWAQSSMMFGVIPYWDNGLKSVAYKDILTKKKRMPEPLIRELERAKISPKVFSDENNHKGGDSIALMMSIKAHYEYQKFSNEKGLQLFLSIGGDLQLQHMLYINDKLKEGKLTYEEFRNHRQSKG